MNRFHGFPGCSRAVSSRAGTGAPWGHLRGLWAPKDLFGHTQSQGFHGDIPGVLNLPKGHEVTVTGLHSDNRGVSALPRSQFVTGRSAVGHPSAP